MYEDVVTVLTGRTTFDNALVQEDYPYGRSRTDRKFWVETATKGAKKDHQRGMFCTLNPKTQRWNKPKATTYSAIIVGYLDEKEHVKLAHLSYFDDAEKVAAFVEMFGEHLTDAQWKTIRLLHACNRVSARLTFTLAEPGEDVPSYEEQRKQLGRMVAQELRNPTPA